jgi:hypothetical protein
MLALLNVVVAHTLALARLSFRLRMAAQLALHALTLKLATHNLALSTAWCRRGATSLHALQHVVVAHTHALALSSLQTRMVVFHAASMHFLTPKYATLKHVQSIAWCQLGLTTLHALYLAVEALRANLAQFWLLLPMEAQLVLLSPTLLHATLNHARSTVY